MNTVGHVAACGVTKREICTILQPVQNVNFSQSKLRQSMVFGKVVLEKQG
jgi:hypothetical protein